MADHANPKDRVSASPVPPSRSDNWEEVSEWRSAERARLIARRLSLDPKERRARSGNIANALDSTIQNFGHRIVGTYWPFRGELDLRNWGLTVIERGGRLALPVVVDKARPLEYRLWAPGDPMKRGVWNILYPAQGQAAEPEIVIAPLVGFDGARYRLGYGGGFFDRTLAAMRQKPLAIGVGYDECRLPTIYPQQHDIPMDVVLTV